MTVSRRKFLAFSALAAVSAGAIISACGTTENRADFPVEPNPGEVGATIAIEGLRWSPDAVTIKAGQSVVWNMHATTKHDLKVLGMLSPLLTDGEIRVTFKDAGVYPFECTIHPGMDGVVTVEPASSATTTTTP